jgi:hypothetical protein
VDSGESLLKRADELLEHAFQEGIRLRTQHPR